MNENSAADDRSHVRRADRAEHDETWIRSLLHRAPVGYVATSRDGQPFINSNLFVYDEAAHAIYFHTARKGRTRSNVQYRADTCFTVAEMGRLLPAETALSFSVEYNSVVVFGLSSIVKNEAAAKRALQTLLDKYFANLKPGEDYRSPVREELKRTSVYRLDIQEWSGKRKKVGAFPGAFFYARPGEYPDMARDPDMAKDAPFNASRDGYELSTDPARLDIDVIHAYLANESYWAKGRSRDRVARALKHSLCVGVYSGSQQVGFARAITDYAVHAYIADVFVLPAHRGRGLGKWLVSSLLAHPLLRDINKWSLYTMDAHGLYEPFGFGITEPGRHMRLNRKET